MNEINYSNMSLCDTTGRVFEMNGTIYRGIYDKDSDILEFLKTDLFKTLESKGFIPKTKISDLKVAEFVCVLEHETASCVNYPHEWSFEMHKDACLLLLNLEEICNAHNFMVKDAHLFNVVFFYGIPKFVDLGSFVKKTSEPNSFFIGEFKTRAYLPLLIWSEGNYGLAYSIIRESSARLTLYDLVEIYRGLLLIKNLGVKSVKKYLNARKNIFHSFDTQSIPVLKEIIQSLKLNNYHSTWVNYHQGLYNNGKLISTPRFDKIISIVNELNVTSISDVACNEGHFSMLVNQNCKSVKKIISIDFDENAINNFYKIVKQDQGFKNITMMVNNMVVPSNSHYEVAPDVRYKSDCVIALAVTHHLIFGQKYRIDVIFSKLASLSNKYVIVEFMPHGLWAGEGHPKPQLPAYYTEEWYVNSMKKKFKVLNRYDLEANRICFVCEKI